MNYKFKKKKLDGLQKKNCVNRKQYEIHVCRRYNMKYVEDRIKRTTNQFLKDVLQSVININKKTLVTGEYVLTSPIYYNKNIQIGGTHVY